jgi:hypothetical protein
VPRNWITSTTGTTVDTKTFDEADKTLTASHSIDPTYDLAGNMRHCASPLWVR